MEQTMQLPKIACIPKTSQRDDLGSNEFIVMVVNDALQSRKLRELIIYKTKEALKPHLQRFTLKDLIMKGNELVEFYNFPKCRKSFRHFCQSFVMLIVNEILEIQQLDIYVVRIMQQSLTLGQLDDTLVASATTVKQSLRHSDVLIDLIPAVLKSRQLDNILSNILNEAVQTGVPYDLAVIAAAEALQSMNMHVPIERTIDELVFQVST